MDSKKCESCLRENFKICAEYWCFDCDEPLCSDCLKNHRKTKFLMNHHTVDLDFIDIFPTAVLSSISRCQKHGDGRVEWFCVDHESLCCRHCMTESHRTCKSILPIEIASKDVKGSPLPSMLSQDLTLYLQTLNSIIANREDAAKSFDKMTDDIKSRIQSFKSSIIDHIDRLEKCVIDDLKDFHAEEKDVMNKDLEDISENRKNYHRSKSDLDVVLQHGSEAQIFLFTHNLAQQLAKDEVNIQKMAQTFKDIKVEFISESKLPDVILSLGKLKISKHPCLLRTISQTRRQAQVITKPIATKTQFLFRSQIDISCSESVQITAIAATKDNRLILCNRYSNRLLVYHDSGKFLQDCSLLCKPWDIAILPDEVRAVVTLPLENSIQFINISTMIPDKEQVSIHCKCHGVAVVLQSIVVGANRELYILDLKGEIMTRVQIPGQLVYFLHRGESESVYYTDYHSVYHVYMNGTEIFRYDHPELKVPEGIARDNQGYLCVAGRGSQNVHRIGHDGQLIDIVLSKSDGVILPWAVSFSTDCSKVFISTHDGKSISVYDIHVYSKQK